MNIRSLIFLFTSAIYIPAGLQERISAIVRRSFALRKESRRLPDEARRMVEGAIEG